MKKLGFGHSGVCKLSKANDDTFEGNLLVVSAITIDLLLTGWRVCTFKAHADRYDETFELYRR